MKAAYIDSAAKAQPRLGALQDSSRVALDSALKYNETMQKLPARVTFSEFAVTEKDTNLGGTVMNNGDTNCSYSLKIDFLDKAGTVVGSQTVAVGPVAGHKSGSFRVQGPGSTVTAFRYAPLSCGGS